MMPTITVFGSCRVYTPCSLLAKAGHLRMNQQNIFGYTHYSKEIFQQFELVSGARHPPSRLKPYMNIPTSWTPPPVQEIANFHRVFADTDVFVVEVSSIREVMFKAIYLQINRVRELLAPNDEIVDKWWTPLLRTGVNDISQFPLASADPVEAEVAVGLSLREQTPTQLEADIRKIIKFLAKPVIVVSHFDTDYKKQSIPQRKMIVDILATFGNQSKLAFFDPTREVLVAGLETALQDLGHYKPEFEPHIASCLLPRILQVIPARQKAVVAI